MPAARSPSIEINGTFYGSQKPASFIKWAEETPDDFVFSMKAPRFAVNRRVLAEAGPSIEKFFASGVHHLKSKLGPILWQFAPHKKYEPDDFAAFLDLLPENGRRIEAAPRHRGAPRKLPGAGIHGAAAQAQRRHRLCPSRRHIRRLADVTADFVYARLQSSAAKVETGYTTADLKKWAARARGLVGRQCAEGPARRRQTGEARKDGCLPVLHFRRERAQPGCGAGADQGIAQVAASHPVPYKRRHERSRDRTACPRRPRRPCADANAQPPERAQRAERRPDGARCRPRSMPRRATTTVRVVVLAAERARHSAPATISRK